MLLSSKGFTFSEIIIVVAIMGIVSSIALKNMGKSDDRANYEESLGELQDLSKAIVGDENARSNGERTSFGFVGDVGGLPSTLDALVSRGALSASKLDTSKQLAYGWKGPYIESPFSSSSSDFKTDGWGNAYTYSTAQYALAPGDTVVAKISSLGSDGEVGGTGYASDIFIEIKKDAVWSVIEGCITDPPGNPVVNAIVRVYLPDGSGGLTSKYDNTDITGCYTVLAVSQGIRGITIQPASGIESEGYRSALGRSLVTVRNITSLGTIILIGIPVASGPNGEDLDFDIKNELGEDVDIVDFSVVYTPFDAITGPRYGSMNIGGPNVWTFAAIRAGSGVLLSTLNTFSTTAFNDNATKAISLDNFQDDIGTDINVFGTEFTATLYASDGSQYVVGPFIAGGQPTLQLVSTPATQGPGTFKFDVKNNTGGDLIITDMQFVYTPFDAGTGPKFDLVKIGNSTAYSGASFSAGSADLLSTVGTFTNTSILNGATAAVTTNSFVNDKNKKQGMAGYEFTVTFYTALTSYVIGPMIVQ